MWANMGDTLNCVRGMRRAWLAGLWLGGAIALGGCQTDHPVDTEEGVPPITTETIQENAEVQYYPSDEPLRLGIEHFNRGHFGIAERYFRDAVEKAPDVLAWAFWCVADRPQSSELNRFSLRLPPL